MQGIEVHCFDVSFDEECIVTINYHFYVFGQAVAFLQDLSISLENLSIKMWNTSFLENLLDFKMQTAQQCLHSYPKIFTCICKTIYC